MNKLPCPPPDTLESLLAARLSAEQETIVANHIEHCKACQARLETLTDDRSLKSYSHRKQEAGSAEAAPAWLMAKLIKPATEAREKVEVLSFLKPPVQEGDLGLLGAYRIKQVLGRGGMGVVLLAYDTTLKRLVALKVLWPPPDDAAARNRIFREAQAVAKIRHEHVVGIYAVHNEPGEPPYLAMEYVPGKTLRDHLKEADVPVTQVVQWCIEIANGLSAAHAAGLIHRDLKSTNILIDEHTHHARLTDFGFTRIPETQSDHTKQSLLAGTPAYMSPEQIQHPELVDARSDVYGLGATLYEALTGAPPYRGPVEKLIQQVIDVDPVPPRRLNLSIPLDVETICMKCLAKEPAQRYAGTADLAADLHRYLEGKPILARPIGVLGRILKAIKRRPVPAALAALLLVSLLAGSLISLFYWRRAEKNLLVANEKIETAFRTIDRFCLRVSEDRLLNEPGMLPLRKELLQIAIPELQKLSFDRPSDPRLHEKWIKSTYLLAKLKHDIEGPAQALPLLATVLPDLHERHQSQRENADDRRLLADVLMYQGICQENMQQYPQAEAVWKEIEQLLKDQKAPEDQLILARLYVNWNKTWADQLNYGRSDEYAQRAQSIARELTRQHPELTEGRYVLATSTGNLAQGQTALGRPQLAEQNYHEAIDLWKQIIATDPKPLLPQIEMLRTQINLIELLLYSQRYGEAATMVNEEVPSIDRLIRKYPQSITLIRFHGNLHLLAGFAEHLNGHSAQAQQHYQQSVIGLSTSHAENPNEVPVYLDLIRARLLQAYQWQDARQLEKALASWEELLPMLHDYVTQVPDAEQAMKEYRHTVLLCRAMVQAELDKPALAREDIQAVLDDHPKYTALCKMARLLMEEKITGKDQATELMKHYRKMMEECLAAEKLGPSAASLYYLAATCAARSIPFIAKDTSLSPADQAGQTEEYRNAALRWLKASQAYGYFATQKRRDALSKNTSLQLLHQSPKWKALMDEIK